MDTLGEMAHIIAKSANGPRGDPGLDDAVRDSYQNLILLCPTHHTEIDRDPDTWTVDRLRRAKTDHEAWVSEQLSRGRIELAVRDNTRFLEARKANWLGKAHSDVAVVVALTPLQLTEVLTPVSPEVQRLLESARLPGDHPHGEPLNRYKTRPDENGLINEVAAPPDHSISIWRVGHCEYFYSLRSEVARITDYVRREDPEILKNARQVVRYTDTAEVVVHATRWLFHVWRSGLQQEYATYTVALLNTAQTNLYTGAAPYGFPTGAPSIDYSSVVEKEADEDDVSLLAVRRLSEAYGLTLANLRDAKGEYARPDRMR